MLVSLAPLATLAGTILTAVPAVRAAYWLRLKTPDDDEEESGDDTAEQEDALGFPLFLRTMNERLEAIAQHWPPYLFWLFFAGVGCLVYSASINMLVQYRIVAASC